MLMRVTRSPSATLGRDGIDDSGLIASEEELLSPQLASANEDGNRPGSSSRKKRVKVGTLIAVHFFSFPFSRKEYTYYFHRRVWILFVVSPSSS